ncbi:MAG: hypothetical protein AAF570_16410 [Bacteroidota bacterium]
MGKREKSGWLRIPKQMDVLDEGEAVVGYEWDLEKLNLGEAKYLYIHVGEIERINYRNKKFPLERDVNNHWIEIILGPPAPPSDKKNSDFDDWGDDEGEDFFDD